MKKLLVIIFFTLMIFNPAISGPYGEGELKLSDRVVEYFLKYIGGKGFKSPGAFYVTLDGYGAMFWYCADGSNCAAGAAKTDLKDCEIKTGKECKKFARKRTIKWKNGINPGKGKISRISSKLDLNELKAKLTELGFYGNTTTTKKIEKKETKKTDSKKQKAMDECQELGFTKGTEKFGDCVMKMLSM